MPSFSPPVERTLGAPSSNPDPSSSPSALPSIRVFLADDHPTVRQALRNAIEAEKGLGFCGEAASSKEALRQIEGLAPDVAVVDLSLEESHGLDLLEHLQASARETQVIVFSMYDEEVYAERALRAGASGYLEKSEPLSLLIDAIRCTSNGRLYLSRRMHRRLGEEKVLEGDATEESVLAGGVAESVSELRFPIDQLTERERQIFEMLGEAKTVEEIESQLGLTRRTVESHRWHIKDKLGLDSVNELVQHALQWSLDKESMG